MDWRGGAVRSPVAAMISPLPVGPPKKRCVVLDRRGYRERREGGLSP